MEDKITWTKDVPSEPGQYIARDPENKTTMEVSIKMVNNRLTGKDIAGHFDLVKETSDESGAYFGIEWIKT